MPSTQAAPPLDFDWSSVTGPTGSLRHAAELMIADLRDSKRLDVEHAPLVQLLLKLSDALELASGRGASVALLSAQYMSVWEKLATIPYPVDDDDDTETTYDVVLHPVRMPDAS